MQRACSLQLVLLLLLTAATQAQVQPQLDAVYPAGIQRGTETVLELRGRRLA